MSPTDSGAHPDGRVPDDTDRRRHRRVPNGGGDEYQSMSHLDPDQLATLALDPGAGDGLQDDHLAACARCRRELETLRDVTARARRADRAEPLPLPPEQIWDNVVRELSASGDLTPQRGRAPLRWQPWALAAALVLAAVLAATALLPLTDRPEVVASATLEPLDDVSQARAQLLVGDDGHVLEIDELDLPDTDGYYELWLLTAEGDGLVSLGPVEQRASVDVPTVIDTERFSVVDISREPPDGDPSHSTDSVLRGALEPPQA